MLELVDHRGAGEQKGRLCGDRNPDQIGPQDKVGLFPGPFLSGRRLLPAVPLGLNQFGQADPEHLRQLNQIACGWLGLTRFLFGYGLPADAQLFRHISLGQPEFFPPLPDIFAQSHDEHLPVFLLYPYCT